MVMPLWGFFVIGFLIYCSGAYLSYNDTLKELPYYQYIGIIIGAVANFIWFTIAKITPDKSDIIRYGIYWDVIILAAFMLVPALFFINDIKLTNVQVIGIITIIVGIVLTKL